MATARRTDKATDSRKEMFAHAKAVNLAQRGRAGLEILGSLQHYVAGTVRGRARSEFEADADGAQLAKNWTGRHNEPWSERIAKARTIAQRSPAYRYERLMQRYVAEQVFVRGIIAAEQRREDAEAFYNAPLTSAGGTLELDPALKLPDWYTQTEWHLMPGGWDGYDLMSVAIGSGIGPLVFSRGGYAAVEAEDDIRQQRVEVVKQFPKTHYGRIYEPGCGGTSTLYAVHKRFPDAELIGSDFSPHLLKQGLLSAERFGFKVTLKQRDAADTREPANSMDGVIMYALQHEMPVEVNIAALKEAFRILKPGGDLVISDPPPFSAVDPLQAVVLDWDNDHRDEPFFSVTREIEWEKVLDEIGFVDTEAYGLGAHGYPWIVRGSKPV